MQINENALNANRLKPNIPDHTCPAHAERGAKGEARCSAALSIWYGSSWKLMPWRISHKGRITPDNAKAIAKNIRNPFISSSL